MFPRLATPRLVLDAFTADDVPALVERAGHPDIAATTLHIPHPYTAEDGGRFVSWTAQGFLEGNKAIFAVRQAGGLMGGAGLQLTRADDRAELGYWIARPGWGQGFATEAARAVAQFGFAHFQLEKICAHHFAGNDASGRVLQKIGFAREGYHPRQVKKNGRYIDYISYGLTRAAAAAAGLIAGSEARLVFSSAVDGFAPLAAPPPADLLAAVGAGAVERALVTRHFHGRTPEQLEGELRVYSQSLAADFGRLSPMALAYYLPAAQTYLASEFAAGDWDFAHGLAGALAQQVRNAPLPDSTRAAVRDTLRFLRDHAARFQLELDNEPLAGWLRESLAGA